MAHFLPSCPDLLQICTPWRSRKVSNASAGTVTCFRPVTAAPASPAAAPAPAPIAAPAPPAASAPIIAPVPLPPPIQAKFRRRRGAPVRLQPRACSAARPSFHATLSGPRVHAAAPSPCPRAKPHGLCLTTARLREQHPLAVPQRFRHRRPEQAARPVRGSRDGVIQLDPQCGPLRKYRAGVPVRSRGCHTDPRRRNQRAGNVAGMRQSGIPASSVPPPAG